MSAGVDHYEEAMALLAHAAGEISTDAHEDRMTAQVHATLALTDEVARVAVALGSPRTARGRRRRT